MLAQEQIDGGLVVFWIVQSLAQELELLVPLFAIGVHAEIIAFAKRTLQSNKSLTACNFFPFPA